MDESLQPTQSNTSTPLPVTIIGGYLGSGKTTLINHLLRHAGGERLAILVNDFGDLAIDAALIETQNDDIISLTGGCVCCSYGNDLSLALIRLLEREERPDQVFIESSGVALPGAIAQSLSLLTDYRCQGVVVLVDSENVLDNINDRYIGDTLMRQLGSADLVLLNKIDLVGESRLFDVKAWLDDQLADIPVIEVTFSELAPQLLLGISQSLASDRLNAQDNETLKGDSAPGADQNHAHADKLFDTCVVIPQVPMDAELLAARLRDHPMRLIRAKGFVQDANGIMHTIQLVGKRCTVSPAPPDVKSGLVCIGSAGTLSEESIQSLCRECSRDTIVLSHSSGSQ